MRARSAVAALAASSVLAASLACGREDRETPDQLRAEIEALEKERDVAPRAGGRADRQATRG